MEIPTYEMNKFEKETSTQRLLIASLSTQIQNIPCSRSPKRKSLIVLHNIFFVAFGLLETFWKAIKELEYCSKFQDKAIEGLKRSCTLKTKPMETPTTKRKKGITKSASVTPNHGEWFKDGKARPTSSTNIINCKGEPLCWLITKMKQLNWKEKETNRNSETAEDIERNKALISSNRKWRSIFSIFMDSQNWGINKSSSFFFFFFVYLILTWHFRSHQLDCFWFFRHFILMKTAAFFTIHAKFPFIVN